MICPSRDNLLFGVIDPDEYPDVVIHLKQCNACLDESRRLTKILDEAIIETDWKQMHDKPSAGDEIDVGKRDRIWHSIEERIRQLSGDQNEPVQTAKPIEVSRKLSHQRYWLLSVMATAVVAIFVGTWIWFGFWPRNNVQLADWERISPSDVRHRQLSSISGGTRVVGITDSTYRPERDFEILLPESLAGYAVVVRLEGTTLSIIPSRGQGTDLASTERTETGQLILGPFETFKQPGVVAVIVTSQPAVDFVREYFSKQDAPVEPQFLDALISQLGQMGLDRGSYMLLRLAPAEPLGKAHDRTGDAPDSTEAWQDLLQAFEQELQRVRVAPGSESREQLLNRLADFEQSLGSRHASQLRRPYQAVASVLESDGRFDAARDLLALVVAIDESTGGSDDQKTESVHEHNRLARLADASPEDQQIWRKIDATWRHLDNAVNETQGIVAPELLTEATATLPAVERLVGRQSYDHLQRIGLLYLHHLRRKEYSLSEKYAIEAFELTPLVYGSTSNIARQAPSALAVLYQPWRIAAENAGRFDEAETCAEKERAAFEALFGAAHWQTRTSKRALDRAKLFRHDVWRVAAYEEAKKLFQAEQEAEGRGPIGNIDAVRLMEAVVDKLERAAGPNDMEVFDAISNLAVLYMGAGSENEAVSMVERANLVVVNVAGKDSPEYIRHLQTRIGLLTAMGRTEEALATAHEAYDRSAELMQIPSLSREPLLVHAKAASTYGERLMLSSKFTDAKLILEGARRMLEPFSDDPTLQDILESVLHNLAAIAFNTGQSDTALDLLREVVDRTARRAGADTLPYAQSLAALGSANVDARNFQEADEQLQRAQHIIRSQLPKEESRYLGISNERLRLCRLSGRSGDAVSIIEETLRAPLLGRNSLGLGAFLHSAGAFCDDDAAAVDYLERGGSVFRELFGESHRLYVLNRCVLALRRKDPGDKRLLLLNLEMLRTGLDWASEGQDEEAQIALATEYRRILDQTIDATGLGLSDSELYEHLASWKGIAFSRSRLERFDKVGLADRSREILARIRSTDARLASTYRDAQSPSQPDALTRLMAERESLMHEFQQASPQLVSLWESQRASVSEICECLPMDTVLVDFFDYDVTTPRNMLTNGDQQQLVAFILRKGTDVRRVNLGPSKPIALALVKWQKAIDSAPSIQDEQFLESGKVVRDKIWQPLEQHLDGIERVFVGTDGVVSFVPFAALPTDRASEVLINELEISIIPVPQLIPFARLEQAKHPLPANPEFIGVAEVDYDRYQDGSLRSEISPSEKPATSSPGSAEVTEDSSAFDFQAGGIDAVNRLFTSFRERFPTGMTRVLQASQATCREFQSQAPGKHFIHLEVHGDFEPRDQSMTSKRSTKHMRPNGLAMAGANAGGTDTEAGIDDGVLTPSEAASMDLSGCKLVTLAACESRLGPLAAGEGILGMQRSFQLAGAECVVASLWKVDTLVTRRLMDEFYRNVFNEGLSPSESLRQAQLAAIRDELSTGGSTVAPKYWAAWIASGPSLFGTATNTK